MYSLRRVAGVVTIVAAAAILSACTGQQNSPPAGGPTTAPTTTPAATTAAVPAQAITSAPGAKPTPTRANPCASATKGTLEAALGADKELSGALIVDGKGLQRIKCVAPWAFAHFSNEIDGGSVLFTQRNGTWIPVGGGTGELCEKARPRSPSRSATE
jgi:ABC-type transport system substrate-binding protein